MPKREGAKPRLDAAVDPEILEAVKNMSKKTGLSFSAIANMALRRYFDNQQTKYTCDINPSIKI